MTSEMRKDAIDIYNHFGVEKQRDKLQEECFECLSAIEMYNENPTKENYDCMIDEMADDFFIAYQHYLAIPEVRARVEFKIQRTKERIVNKFYKNPAQFKCFKCGVVYEVGSYGKVEEWVYCNDCRNGEIK